MHPHPPASPVPPAAAPWDPPRPRRRPGPGSDDPTRNQDVDQQNLKTGVWFHEFRWILDWFSDFELDFRRLYRRLLWILDDFWLTLDGSELTLGDFRDAFSTCGYIWRVLMVTCRCWKGWDLHNHASSYCPWMDTWTEWILHLSHWTDRILDDGFADSPSTIFVKSTDLGNSPEPISHDPRIPTDVS